MAKNYISGSPIRQEYLETAIKWMVNRDGLDSVEEYMALHQHDDNANQIWIYFKRVIEWVQTIFLKYRREMKGIHWCYLYNEYKDTELDPDILEEEIKRLMMDDDVTNKKGIYIYVLNRNKKHLNIRAFTDIQKRKAYEHQNGICPTCNKHFEYERMEGDHITPCIQVERQYLITARCFVKTVIVEN